MPLFPNYIGACPCFETQFYQNRVMLDQTKKEKKNCMELEFRDIKFREPYSGVLEPYSGFLKPYSGILELDFPKLEFHAIFFFFLV